jgi:hypothetical protein
MFCEGYIDSVTYYVELKLVLFDLGGYSRRDA